jgi:hypothetical protein
VEVDARQRHRPRASEVKYGLVAIRRQNSGSITRQLKHASGLHVWPFHRRTSSVERVKHRDVNTGQAAALTHATPR